MKQDEIIIREYREGDEVQINQLHNEEYGIGRGSEAWRWEFMSGPYGKAIFMVAEHKSEIIGTQALMPITLCYGGKQICSAKSEGTLLKAEYRGLGIFKRLYEVCFELADKRGIALIWGFTYAEGPFRNCGFEIPGKLNHLIISLKPFPANMLSGTRMAAQMKKRIGSQVAQEFLFHIFTLIGFIWGKIRQPKINPRPRFKVIAIDKVDNRLDVFWEAFRQNTNYYTIDRTSKYLDWRIIRNPNMTYQLLAIIENSKIQGYMVLGINKYGNVGSITDLCVLNEYFEEVAGGLISHAVDYFRAQGVSHIDAWCAGNNLQTKKYSACLRKVGFLRVHMGSCVVIKLLSEKGCHPADPYCLDQWFITEIFSEGAG